MTNKIIPYILGLDLGTNSIGWAILGKNGKKISNLNNYGVRVFDAGMEGDIASGKGEPRNQTRREKRSLRRQLDRRRRRKQKVFHLLQKEGLLPEGEPDEVIPKLDLDLSRQTNPPKGISSHIFSQVFPYYLRAKALDTPLSDFELGRALYHLAQRRGYKSNRKTDSGKDEKDGVVSAGISEIEKQMQVKKLRTLGEYFSTLNPDETRIRKQYTSRAMYEDEFDKIVEAQKTHKPEVLTENYIKKLREYIFYQRPLKSQKYLIGHCEYEPGCRRAPKASFVAQRFRMLQMLSNTIIYEDGIGRDFTDEEREKVIDELLIKGDRTFAQIKKILKLPKEAVFNYESGNDKKFFGNRTEAKFRKIFSDRWDDFTDREKQLILADTRTIEKPETLFQRAKKVWGLGAEAAENLVALRLEEGYMRLSTRAMRKLIPLMEKGIPYGQAIREVYPEYHETKEECDFLPPIFESLPEMRNPVVMRTMTELRKVVNTLIRAYGKPEEIRVELAREMKLSAKKRGEISKRNYQNRKSREKAAKILIDEVGIGSPKRSDIEKYLLWEECDGVCPYTGKRINIRSLYGKSPEFDIEHIIPLSRSFDNSFINKTLCHHAENRNVKRNKTPYEAYHGTDKWEEILQRVRNFKSDAMLMKLKRFRLEDINSLEDFTHQQLNDTAYASRLAMDYLGLLYGGVIDKDNKRRVQAGRGRVTGYLRNTWELNKLLGGDGRKNRDDHRHHAVDALVIALTSPGLIKAFSDACAREYRYWNIRLPEPWQGFHADVREKFNDIIVSHRTNHRVRGALHEETIYGRGTDFDKNGKLIHFHVRKPLDSLSKKDVGKIVDPVIQKIISKALADRGGDPKKAFADRKEHPKMPSGVPIHKVRLKRKVNAKEIGNSKSSRNVLLGSNHHVEILEDTTGKKPKWVGVMVTMMEAHERLRQRNIARKKGEKLPDVVQRDHGNGKRFLFSLSGGDIIELDEPNGKRGLYRIRTITVQGGYLNFRFVKLNDARMKKDIIANKEFFSAMPETLRKHNCQKVTISPIGEVSLAND